MSDRFVFHNPIFEERSDGTVVKMINDAIASATGVESGNPATVTVTTDADGIAHFAFEIPNGYTGATGPTGEQGEGFSIYETYASITAMESDAANVPTGKFVMITSNVEDPDNSKMYVKSSDGTFIFVNDLSGSQGIQGPTGATGLQGEIGPTGPTGPTGPGGGIRNNYELGNYIAACTTAVGTIAKEISVTDFVLTVGAYLTVTFTVGNSATAATLNVNNTGAYNIVYYSPSNTAVNIPPYYIKIGETVNLRFDGSYWVIVDGDEYGDLDGDYTNL